MNLQWEFPAYPALSAVPAILNKHRETTTGTCHTWKSTILWLIPCHTMANLQFTPALSKTSTVTREDVKNRLLFSLAKFIGPEWSGGLPFSMDVSLGSLSTEAWGWIPAAAVVLELRDRISGQRMDFSASVHLAAWGLLGFWWGEVLKVFVPRAVCHFCDLQGFN